MLANFVLTANRKCPDTQIACRGTQLVEVTFISGLNADLIAIDCGFDSDFFIFRLFAGCLLSYTHRQSQGARF